MNDMFNFSSSISRISLACTISMLRFYYSSLTGTYDIVVLTISFFFKLFSSVYLFTIKILVVRQDLI
jgi:hypothetical protein